jgi:DNA-binding NtrC family response regulator
MSTQPLIVVVVTDPQLREDLGRSLSQVSNHVVSVQSPDEALAHPDDSVSLVISELHKHDFSGLDLLRLWKSRQPLTPFVLVTEGDDVSSAVEAMKLGAADCLVKPLDTQQVQTLLQGILEHRDHNGRVQAAAEQEVLGESHKSGIDIPPGTSLEDLERAAVEQALAQHHGNRTHAAKTLGISVRTLQRKLKAWGMPLVGSQQNQNRAPHFLVPSHSSHSAPSSFNVHTH